MATVFDPDTLDELRALPPRAVYDRVREHLYRTGATGSDDFREAFEDLVEEGLLTWEQVEEFEG